MKIIEAYKKDVDRTLLRANLQLTPQQRFEKFDSAMRLVMSLRQAGKASQERNKHSVSREALK